jgi:hypothetical protein
MSLSWLGRRVWVLLVLAGVVGGVLWWKVANDDDTTFAGRTELLGGEIPVRENITRLAGADIADGFVVAEGSALVGAPLPFLYSTMAGEEPLEDDGWTAILLVTEPGRAVMERYVEQAVSLGFPVGRFHCETDEAEDLLACSAEAFEGFSYDDGYDHGRSLTMDLLQGPAHRTRPPLSSIVITHRRVGDAPYPRAEPTDSAPTGTDVAGEVPVGWPAIPDVGEQFWSSRPFEVVPGTILLAHPTGLGGTPSGGTLSIFEVTADPDDVFAAFVAQRPDGRSGRTDPVDPASSWTRDGVTMHQLSWLDGQGQTLRIWERPGRPTLLVVETTPSD